MNDQTLRFRLGIFVLASIILLGIMIVLFGGFPSYFKRTDTYVIVFDDVHGIAPGAPVRRSGVRIGEVRSILLENETGKVNVEIRVDGRYTLRKGDRAAIVQGLLGGDASVTFLPPADPKKVDNTPIEAGAVIQGETTPDPGIAMQKAADLVDPAKEALIEVRNVMRRLDRMGPTMEEAMHDFRDLSRATRELAPELRKTNQELQTLAKPTRETLAEVQMTARYWGKVGERVDVLLKTNEDKIVKSIERMELALKQANELLGDENQKLIRETLRNTRNASTQFESLTKDTSEMIKDTRVTLRQVTETMKRADEAIQDLQKTLKPLGDRGPGVFKNLDESSENLNKTLKDLRELMQVIARSDGTIQRLLTDPALYNNLNDSAEMVTKLMPRLDRILRDMEIFSDKLARHPELIGIGGVIRPSSGLKESPSVIPYRVIPTHTPPPSVIPFRVREWHH